MLHHRRLHGNGFACMCECVDVCACVFIQQLAHGNERAIKIPICSISSVLHRVIEQETTQLCQLHLFYFLVNSNSTIACQSSCYSPMCLNRMLVSSPSPSCDHTLWPLNLFFLLVSLCLCTRSQSSPSLQQHDKGEIDCSVNAAADLPDMGGGDIGDEIMGQTLA